MGQRVYLTAAIGVMGLVVGYLAQRSRMCFVAGLRDFLLVRDGELLLGFFSFVLTIWLLTTAFYSLGLLKKGAPEYGEPAPALANVSGPSAANDEPRNGPAAPASRGPRTIRFLSAPFFFDSFAFVSIAGGWVVGLLSTFAGGCVLRQHVLAAQGSRDASWYLAGFYAAVPVFYLLLSRFIYSIY
jgi:uncharacterized membrane protein YedE/YeeE